MFLCLQENRMDAHNLSVCVAPNLFQTKQNCKVIQQQNAAVEICIKYVLNIGEWWTILKILLSRAVLFLSTNFKILGIQVG